MLYFIFCHVLLRGEINVYMAGAVDDSTINIVEVIIIIIKFQTVQLTES